MNGITDANTITYVMVNTIDECNVLPGLQYTMMRSEKTYAGSSIYPRTILSKRSNHIHELIHAVMIPLFPEAPSILHEGIATYYGGGATKDYNYHLSALKEYLARNSVDFSNREGLYKEMSGGVQLYNTLGAMIVDYALQHGGEQKVLSLLESKNYEEIFEKLEVERNSDAINDFVLQTLIR